MKQYKGIWLPAGETHLQEHIDLSPLVDNRGTYQLRKLNKAMKYVRGSQHTALDIGAHVGLWTRILLKLFTEVVAFEPVQEHVDCLVKNLKWPTTSNLTLHQVALGAGSGVVDMAIKKGNSGMTHVQGSGTQVPMTTLDSYRLDNIDLIKIDVEGFERNVVEGARETILRNKPIVICEHKGHDLSHFGKDADAIGFLVELGMERKDLISGDYIMGWPDGAF